MSARLKIKEALVSSTQRYKKLRIYYPLNVLKGDSLILAGKEVVTFKKVMVFRDEEALIKWLVGKSICPECGAKLPDPIIEQREGGRSESVTECPCGAVYTS